MMHWLNNAEARFPGFPVAGGQTSDRINITGSLRSTLGKNLVNQFVTGYTKSTVNFFTEVTPASFSGTSVADQAGFALNIGSFPSSNGITPAVTTVAAAGYPRWVGGRSPIRGRPSAHSRARAGCSRRPSTCSRTNACSSSPTHGSLAGS